MITEQQLREAQARVLEARAVVLTAQTNRDKLILQAVADGWSQHRIARVLEIAQPSVRELIQRAAGDINGSGSPSPDPSP